MAEGAYGACKAAAEGISYHRHHGLKNAEEQCGYDSALQIELFHAQSLTDRHGKGVHRKSDRNKKQFCY